MKHFYMKIKKMIMIYYSHNDVATWPEVLTHNMRVEMIKFGPDRFQNKEALESSLLLQRVKGDVSRKYPRAVYCVATPLHHSCLV